MKFLVPFLLVSYLNTPTVSWQTDLDKAKAEAAQTHKSILLNFSGSDWCVPCIRLHKDIFDAEAFEKYADSNLVLVNADFPRLKKNQLPKAIEKKNEELADKYNPQGNFPLTLLLDENGNVVKKWEGYINLSPQSFVNELNTILHGRSTASATGIGAQAGTAAHG